ncbi:PRD domain-containing protein [Kineothrix sp. MB12-C1]|uniref:PRD domain-containing protein n=1 Tax=Kineothrix sp. MB12-C1 TaxID=3070215 RepID=UPI0027D235EE|nr:PRD domain-containing protein [Kineothrix sp. MB12-C1]WMC92384.1 PRD domain-containing protein [Kineothrix sp. MB12-C1]
MKIIKNINNNISLCLDSNGREVIAFGKGIGFIKPPCEVPLNKIERTFYNIKEFGYDAIKDIPSSVIKAAMRIVDGVERELNVTLMSTATLALADHINFAIQRMNEHIVLDLPIQEDIKQIYPDEMKQAYKALTIIEEETGVTLDRNEVGTIALHFINNQIDGKENNKVISKDILKESIALIEKEFDISINVESFNYSRFATHVDYLLTRLLKNNQIKSVNISMYETLKLQYPNTYCCVADINTLFKEKLNIALSDEEKLYLILHINRLCSREK